MHLTDPIVETLLIPLYMRACQSRAKDPIINDPDAVRLAEQMDYDFAKFDSKKGSQIGVALRASYFDDKCRAFLTQHPDGVAVNVGCGLDTRWQRLGNVAKHAHLYSLDIAESMALREQLLPALPNETYLTASMFETTWLDNLAKKHPNTPTLFVVEGVMMYFSLTQNRTFLVNVADSIHHADIYFDTIGKFTHTHQKRHDTVGQMRATFESYLDDPMLISQWHDRLHYMEHWYFGDLPQVGRMGRVFGVLMKVVPMLRKSSVFVGYQVR